MMITRLLLLCLVLAGCHHSSRRAYPCEPLGPHGERLAEEVTCSCDDSTKTMTCSVKLKYED